MIETILAEFDNTRHMEVLENVGSTHKTTMIRKVIL